MAKSNGNGNGKGNPATPKTSKIEEAHGYEDVFDQPLVSTDLPDGQYPARLAGKTAVFMVPSRFERTGKAPRFKFLFAVRNPQTGHVVILQSKLLSPPSRQSAGGGVNSKSNLYQILKPLAGDDTALWDLRADTIKSGATMNQFIGRTANVVVERDDGGFSRIEQVVIAPAGTTFPSEDETSDALQTHEDNAEERAAQGGGRGYDGPAIDDEPGRDTRVES